MGSKALELGEADRRKNINEINCMENMKFLSNERNIKEEMTVENRNIGWSQ